MDFIIYEKKDCFASIALNRPKKLNALNDQMLTEVREALLDADADEQIRVVILKGNGRAFSAGFDVSADQTPKVTPADWNGHFSNAWKTFMTIWDMEKPVIAQVQGHCLGGGFDLTMACDLTIAAENAQFGEPISAERALELGLINQMVPLESLEQAVLNLAKKLARLPLGTPNQNKRLINRAYELMNVREALTLSRDHAVHVLLSKDGEALEFDRIVEQEGLKAALRWREAKFP